MNIWFRPLRHFFDCPLNPSFINTKINRTITSFSQKDLRLVTFQFWTCQFNLYVFLALQLLCLFFICLHFIFINNNTKGEHKNDLEYLRNNITNILVQGPRSKIHCYFSNSELEIFMSNQK